MVQIRGGVTAAKGFTASGIHVGIRKNREKKDLALVWSEKPCSAAAVYTTNQVKGQPLIVTKEHLADGKAQAIIVNAGNANTCTGEAGIAAARRMAALVSQWMGIPATDVVVASTGVIGQQLDVGIIETGMEQLVAGLGRGKLSVIGVPGALSAKEYEQLGVARISYGPWTQNYALTAYLQLAEQLYGDGKVPESTKALN